MNWFRYNNFNVWTVSKLTLLIYLLTLAFLHNSELQIEFASDKSFFQPDTEESFENLLKKQMVAIVNQLESDSEPESIIYPQNYNASWYIAHKGIIQYKITQKSNLRLTQNWEKHFMLGAYMGKKSPSVFEAKSMNFLQQPISYNDFIGKQNQLQSMQVGMDNIAYSYIEKNKSSVLVVFGKNPKSEEKIEFKKIQIITNESPIKVHAKQALIFSLLFFICVFMLHKTPLGFFIRRTFARQYALFYFSLLILLSSFLLIHIQSIQKVKEFQIKEDIKQLFKEHLNEVEKGYSQFKEDFGKELSNALINRNKPSSQNLLRQLNLPACFISKQGLSFLQSEDEVPAILDFLCKNYGHKFYELQADAQPSDVDLIEKLIEKQFPSINSNDNAWFMKEALDKAINKGDRIGIGKIVNSENQNQFREFDVGYNRIDHLWTRTPPNQPITIALSFLKKEDQSLEKFYIQHVKKNLRKKWYINVIGDSNSNQSILSETEHIESILSSNLLDVKLRYSILKEVAFSNVRQFRNQILLILLLAFLLAIPSWYYMSSSMTKPIKSILNGLASIQRRQWSPITTHHKNEFGDVVNHFNEMVFKLREKAELSSFVAENILSLMSDENGGLKDQVEGNAAVLFSDIRSFTTISETHDPLEVVEMLNEYFEIWQQAVQKRGGVIERFIGDAVVVIFFEQFSNQYHQDAVQCALDVMEKMPDFNSKRCNNNQFTVKNGVGISQGKVRFSVIGDHIKKHLFASGSAVIKAEELEAMSKDGKSSHIFVDRLVYENTKHYFDYTKLDLYYNEYNIHEIELEDC